MISPARIAAFSILRKVEAGGYASDLLRVETAALDSRDGALAETIVFGVLRFRAQLDYLIGYYSGASRKLDPEVRIALRMAVYQLRYLERIPPHAAVADSVELVKRARKRSAAGFANAVLRRVDRLPVSWPSREVELSCPEWLLARWESKFGPEIVAGIARAALEPPETYIRISPTGTRIQDIGSQSIVPLLRLESGQRFLDLCAAPGNKTAQALEAGVSAVACDLHFHRLVQMKGVTPNLVVVDGTRPLPFGIRSPILGKSSRHAPPFDRILLDAPCSGTGTVGRNPEIKWRLRREDLADLQRRQKALLANALDVLAPGGILVYSTCSLEPEENEDVVRAVAPDLVLETMQRIPGRDPGDGFTAAVLKSKKAANG